jgi:hypothetical protein
MEERPGVIERAFQIAKSGDVANMAELRKKLAAEGYTNNASVLIGRSVVSQLSRMISEARIARAPLLPSPDEI